MSPIRYSVVSPPNLKLHSFIVRLAKYLSPLPAQLLALSRKPLLVSRSGCNSDMGLFSWLSELAKTVIHLVTS